MSNWSAVKTNWYGKRNENGIYSGDHFEIEDAARLRDNCLFLLETFQSYYPNSTILMDVYPDGEHRSVFDIQSFATVIEGWSPTYSSYFDIHMLERIVIAVRNMYHCNEGIWRRFTDPKYGLKNKEGDFYDLDLLEYSTGYVILNDTTPEMYMPRIRQVIGSDGLWADPYYQGYMYTYRELNALERGMNDLYKSIGFKRQDKYKMLQFMLGVKKGF